MSIEKTPIISDEDLLSAMILLPDSKTKELIEKINNSYEYWDTVKYKRCEQALTPTKLWTLVKAARVKSMIKIWPKYGLTMSLTNHMQKMCHDFDMNFGGSWGANASIGTDNKQQYLIGSLMEEAIYSSQMEGAATTRKVAKEMLRRKMTPKDKSQQMIYNNYQTIQFIVAHKNQPLSAELLLQIHRLMTEHTLQNPEDVGRFRTSDDVVVENGITHETTHTPPSHYEIPTFIDELCQYFNDRSSTPFVHPIIRGIAIHFMVAYIHPFADGNGRTSRALFYWYMLRQGYWLTEYLSISRVIAKSKKSYEKAFLYTETDHMDMGYFATYHLRVLAQSFEQLQAYIQRKQEEHRDANAFLRIGGINARQAEIIKMFVDDPNMMITIKDLQSRFMVSPTTAKTDVVELVRRGLLTEIALNKVKRGYIKGEKFGECTANLA